MALVILKSEQQRRRNRILNTLYNLHNLPKVEVIATPDDNEVIWIKHPQVYVPDFKLQWCHGKEHYRVYIFVACEGQGKVKAGHSICTISNGFSTMGFCMLYSFIHKHRAGSKLAAAAA